MLVSFWQRLFTLYWQGIVTSTIFWRRWILYCSQYQLRTLFMWLFGKETFDSHSGWLLHIYSAHCVVGSRTYCLFDAVLSLYGIHNTHYCIFFSCIRYLPPDPQFLSSMYDFPELFLCLFQECSSSHDIQVDFLTFFSGHVATIVRDFCMYLFTVLVKVISS